MSVPFKASIQRSPASLFAAGSDLSLRREAWGRRFPLRVCARADNHFPARGFTLVELLVVLAILGVIAVFIVPASNSVLRGSQLSQGGQMVNDQLALARQIAVSSNHSVEVRFYRYADPLMPGETAGSPTTGRYRALQVFQILDAGAASPLGKIMTVPPSIIIDSGPTLSSILTLTKTWNAPQGDPQTNLPNGVGTNYNCSAFRFLPDGSTNLTPPTGQWFVTLHNINDKDGITSPPAGFNFFTVQVDATNGHLKTYRP